MKIIFLIAFILLGYFSGSRSVTGDIIHDPCIDAVDIGDPKRSVAYVSSDQDTLLCDNGLDATKWYRFDAFTGGKMPERCVPLSHCGTFGPIWLNGKHPTGNDAEPITVPVCASYMEGECCGWTKNVKVKRCLNDDHEEFFVYQLVPPPNCDLAYCAGDGLPCPPGLGYNSVTKTCTQYPIMTAAPVLGAPYISDWKQIDITNFPKFNATRFSIDCKIGYPRKDVDDGARFDVLFEMNDGTQIATFKANSSEIVVTLDEVYLQRQMGKTLTCKVRSYLESNDPKLYKSKFLPSNGFWFGIRPIDNKGVDITSLVLRQGQAYPFQVRPTYPVTFAHCMDNQKKCFPSYNFRLTTAIKDVKTTDCGFVLSSAKDVSTTITISPVTTVGPGRSIGLISFSKFKHMHQSINQDYTIRSIPVTVSEDSNQPMCESTGDPHITTFGGARYDNYLIGDFNLLSTNDRTFQIQVRHIKCGTVSCNCGVIVREGNNIIGINACDFRREPLIVKYLLDLVSPSGTVEKTNADWLIQMVSGVKVRVGTWRWNNAMFMNIYVQGLKTEKYEGFCAQKTTGATNPETLRVPLEESFFQLSGSNPPKCVNETFKIPTCNCRGRDLDDDGEQHIKVECDADELAKGYKMFVTNYVCGDNGKRRKRSADETSDPVINLDDIYSSIEELDSNYTAIDQVTWPTPNKKITEDQARRHCDDGLKKSPAYEVCKDKVPTAPLVENCVTDIQLTEDLTIANHLATQLEQLCQYHIQSSINTTDDEPDTESQKELEKLHEIQQVICPSQCNQKGTCVNSTCICDQGFIGEDCSMMVGQTPAIYNLISERCDARDSCKSIFVVTANVTNPENATCRIKLMKENIALKFGVYYYKLACISLGTMSCPLPLENFIPSLLNVSVSISNDNKSFSNEMLFLAYDGLCMKYDAKEGCQQKNGSSCLIDDRCHRAGDTHPNDAKKVCDPLNSRNIWTVTSSAIGISVQTTTIIFLAFTGFFIINNYHF